MAVALQTTNSGVYAGTATSGTNLNLTGITQDANCDRVFIGVHVEGNNPAVSSVTYDGVSATLVGSGFADDGTNDLRVSVFEVLAANLPAAGASKTCNVVLTVNAGVTIGVVLLTGASQASVDGLNASSTLTDGDISQSVTVAEADSAVLFFSASGNGGNVSGNQTLLYQGVNINSTTTHHAQRQFGAGTGAQSQTIDYATTPNRTAWVGFAVRAAAAGAELTAAAAFSSGPATSAASVNTSRSSSASFQAGAASASASVNKARSASSAFQAGSASATTAGTVQGNRTASTAFQASSATSSETAARGRVAQGVFQAGSASAAAEALVQTVRSATAEFQAGSASAAATAKHRVFVGRRPTLGSLRKRSEVFVETSGGSILQSPHGSEQMAVPRGRQRITTWRP